MGTTAQGRSPGSAIEPVRPGLPTATVTARMGQRAPSRPAYQIVYLQAEGITEADVRRVLAQVHRLLFCRDDLPSAIAIGTSSDHR
jgi:hypothetical protein